LKGAEYDDEQLEIPKRLTERYQERVDKMKLYNQDCLPAMKEMPDNAYDLAIVDPPYGIGADIVKETKRVRHTKYNKGNAIRKGYSKKWDVKPPKEYFDELFRVSKNQIIWGANYFIEYLRNSSCFLIWDKMQSFTGADFELAFSSFDSSCKAFRMTRIEAYSSGDWRSVHGSKIHPTQKPVALYKWLLTKYAKPGQTILDTHLGSMSSVIACIDMGYSITGYEVDKEYFDNGVSRVQRHLSQGRLFGLDFNLDIHYNEKK